MKQAILLLLILLILGCTNQHPVTYNGVNYTMQDIKLHNDSIDCWIAIDGRVYDLTNWVSLHPGGDEILIGCGANATELFYSFKTHYNGVLRSISEFYIGELI